MIATEMKTPETTPTGNSKRPWKRNSRSRPDASCSRSVIRFYASDASGGTVPCLYFSASRADRLLTELENSGRSADDCAAEVVKAAEAAKTDVAEDFPATRVVTFFDSESKDVFGRGLYYSAVALASKLLKRRSEKDGEYADFEAVRAEVREELPGKASDWLREYRGPALPV